MSEDCLEPEDKNSENSKRNLQLRHPLQQTFTLKSNDQHIWFQTRRHQQLKIAHIQLDMWTFLSEYCCLWIVRCVPALFSSLGDKKRNNLQLPVLQHTGILGDSAALDCGAQTVCIICTNCYWQEVGVMMEIHNFNELLSSLSSVIISDTFHCSVNYSVGTINFWFSGDTVSQYF